MAALNTARPSLMALIEQTSLINKEVRVESAGSCANLFESEPLTSRVKIAASWKKYKRSSAELA